MFGTPVKIIWSNRAARDLEYLHHDWLLRDALSVDVAGNGRLRLVHPLRQIGRGKAFPFAPLAQGHNESNTITVYSVQRLYTKSVLDLGKVSPYHFGMVKSPKPSEMRTKRKASGISQATLAEAVGTSQPQIRRLEADQRKMTGAWALRISRHVPNTIPEDLIFGALTVPIVGYVAAGQAHFEAAYLGQARRPRGAGDATVAVEIRGDSLGAGFNGYIAYYDDRREMPTAIIPNRYYVICLKTGDILVKRLTRRAHHAINQFDLHGAYGDPIPDQFVVWAAMMIDVVPPERAKVEESQEEPEEPQQPAKHPRKGKSPRSAIARKGKHK